MKKLFTLFAALMLGVGVWAETVSYLYPEYNDPADVTKGIKEWKTGSADATEITNASATLAAGWYVVKGTDVQTGTLTCQGAVHLILADGAKLTATGDDDNNTPGIQVSGDGNSLAVYAQSTGDQMGQLIATSGKNAAGIGGGNKGNGSNITINGGMVTATSKGFAAGIGGGYEGAGENITINGGEVRATSEDNGAGIGGGFGGNGENITINGGTVTANGEFMGAGIGGGCESYVGGNGSNITINGGTVTATGEVGAAGIGGGGYGDGSNITINGGIVTANGAAAAGIGGGYLGNGSYITITGGTVTATGGSSAAGIGSGNGGGTASDIFVATNLVVKADGNNPPTTVIENNGDDIASSLAGKQYATVEKITLTAADFTVTKDGDWIYNGTEQKVKIEFNPELIAPSKDNITIYYNNDKLVKPINAGTYQVYIDIRETDTYAAVTGITSEDWKFTIEKADPTADLFTYTAPKDLIWDGEAKWAIVMFDDPSGQLTGMGNVTVKYNGSTEEPIAAGDYVVSIDVAEGVNYNAATALTDDNWKFTITKRTIEVKPDNFKISKTSATYDGEEHYATVVLEDKFAGAGAVTVTYKTLSGTVVEKPINAGTYYIYVTIAGSDGYEAVPETQLGKRNLAIKLATPTADMFTVTPPENLVYAAPGEDGHYKTAKATFNDQNGKLTGMGTIRVDYKNVNTGETFLGDPVSAIGTYQVYLQIAKGDNYNERLTSDKVTSENWQFTIVAPTPVPEWITVREGMTINDYGTLCWDYNLTDIEGAELYSVAGLENDRIMLEEVFVNETQAGASYVIRYTATTLRVKNGLEYAKDPAPAAECNGLQGTFEKIVDGAVGAAGNILEGNYIVYNNEWRKCGGYTGLLANRAYLIMNYVPGGTVTQAPNRKYISMPLPKQTPTELESVDGAQCTMHNGKFIINGQLIIMKDNKMFNAQGIEL